MHFGTRKKKRYKIYDNMIRAGEPVVCVPMVYCLLCKPAAVDDSAFAAQST